MSKFKRFTFRDKRSTPHQVGGTEFNFYPNRMSLLNEARDLSTPVAKAISVLFADESNDNGSSVKRQNDADFYVEDITTDPISVEMAKHRQNERGQAIETIMSTLADSRALILLGRLFMDSLRDEFEYKKERPASEVEAWLYGEESNDPDAYTGLDMPVLIEMFGGWMKANAKVFGAAGEKMVGLVKGRLEQVTAQVSETADSTSGNDSKIPSSLPLEQDSMPPTSIS